MADNAPTPTLNNTAPPVNIMDQWFGNHSSSAGQPAPAGPTVQTGTVQTGQPQAVPQVDLSGVVPVLFSVIFLVWVIYTFVVIYHWFRYRHKSWFAVPAIALHLFVSGSIIVYMISGLK
jgi:hypothetical protein